MRGIRAEQIYDATDIFQQGILRLGEMRPRYERAKYICLSLIHILNSV